MPWRRRGPPFPEPRRACSAAAAAAAAKASEVAGVLHLGIGNSGNLGFGNLGLDFEEGRLRSGGRG